MTKGEFEFLRAIMRTLKAVSESEGSESREWDQFRIDKLNWALTSLDQLVEKMNQK